MPLGGEFPVSTTEVAFRPAVSMNGDGSFVAVWVGSTFGAGSEFARVLGQRFATTGAPVGAEFQVNTLTTNNQWFPAVAVLPDGGFVVAFGSFASAGTDTDGQSVQARLYDANGTPLGAEFQVNTYTPEAQTFPEVAVDAFGGFVIAWHSTGSSTDINGGEIRARRYGAAGAIPLGEDFQINTYTTGHQQFPDVAMDPNGGFVVAWENVDVALPVQARRYDSSGAPLGDQFTVSPNGGAPPHVAMDAASRFIAVFETFPGTGGGTEITGRRFAAPPGPIAVKVAVIVPGKLFKFVAKGQFQLPDPAVDNPTVDGATLRFIGASESGQLYTLPPACWRGLGPGGDGSKGFRCKDTTCSVIVKEKVIKGVCKGELARSRCPNRVRSRFNSPSVRRTTAQHAAVRPEATRTRSSKRRTAPRRCFVRSAGLNLTPGRAPRRRRRARWVVKELDTRSISPDRTAPATTERRPPVASERRAAPTPGTRGVPDPTIGNEAD